MKLLFPVLLAVQIMYVKENNIGLFRLFSDKNAISEYNMNRNINLCARVFVSDPLRNRKELVLNGKGNIFSRM